MGLIKCIITEGKKEVIIDKIGLPPHLAEYCLKFYDKKFVLYWATTIKNALTLFNVGKSLLRPDYTYQKFIENSSFLKLKQLEKRLKDPILPNIPKDVLKLFKEEPDTPYELFNKAEVYIEMYNVIKDYAERTNQNFQNNDFFPVYEEARDWHDALEASGNVIQLEGDMEVIHKFDDGYYWVDNHDNNCSIEGDAMGHCGRTNADTILSLRSPDGEPHISVAFDYDGVYRQAKGKGNKKPVEKYHKYMHWLFLNDGKYQIKKYNPEYEASEDFQVYDLPENIKNKVLEKYPSIDPSHKLRQIMDDNNLSEEQKFNEIGKLDEDSNIFGGDFKNELSFDTSDDLVIVAKDIDPADYGGGDHVFSWSIGVIRHTRDIYFDGVQGDDYLDYIDTDQYSYDSDEIQHLINLAKEDDEDSYQEALSEYIEREEIVDFEDYMSVHLIDFLQYLYDHGSFYDFNIAIDRVATWSMESQAHDEITKDTIRFIENTEIENALGYSLDWVFDYKNKYDLVYEDGDEVNVKLSLSDIVKDVLDDVTFYERNYLSDHVRPYGFRKEMVQPQYGYPVYGIDKKLYNDIFEDAIYT